MSDTDTQGSITAVRTLADELMGMISLATGLAQAGRRVDLAGLDRQIGLLCAKSLDLPPEDGRGVRPRLIALSGAMEALSRALAAHCARSG